MLFQRRPIETDRCKLINATLYYLLKRQRDELSDFYLEDTSRGINGKAVGYICGLAGAAFQNSGIDPDSTEGWLIMVKLLDSLGDSRGEDLLSQMKQRMKENPDYIKGIQLGRADYDAWIRSGGYAAPDSLKTCVV